MSFLIDRSLTRRRFLGTATAATAALGAAPLLGSRANAATPKKGGTLRYGVGHGSTADTLNPGIFDNNFTIAVAYTLHNHIGEVTSDGELIGEIAESWEASADVKQWVFKIREGVPFHNGKTVTPEDVVASIDYHRREGSASVAGALVEQITDMRVDGQNVVIDLEAGNADFPYIMSNFHLPILPSEDGEIDWKNGIGCGPYRLEGFQPGVGATFTRFENYWKEDRAHFDAIQLEAIVDPAARNAALMSGTVDLIDRVDLKTAERMASVPNVEVLSIPGLQHYTFPMLTDQGPFTDVNVRLALKHACPRQEMVDKILFGHGSVGNDHPIADPVPFSADLEQRAFDPEKARFHLKKAGLDSLDVSLHSSEAAFGGAVDAASLYAERAREAGININVVREPNDGYWTDVWMRKPWCACYWSGRPTVDDQLSIGYMPNAAWNDTNWVNDRFVALVRAGRAELDPAKRAEIYFEAQQILSDDGGAVVPMFANYVFAKTDKLAHGDIAMNTDMDGQKFAERWWFA
jgi:peptide/nickel transport system substrate-binding protein